jgi:hypothetical protein
LLRNQIVFDLFAELICERKKETCPSVRSWSSRRSVYRSRTRHISLQIYRTPQGLHQACRWLDSFPMIPRFAAYAVSLLAALFLISACASRDESVVEESTAAPSAPMLGKPVYNPGTEGMSASHEGGAMGAGGNGVTPGY